MTGWLVKGRKSILMKDSEQCWDWNKGGIEAGKKFINSPKLFYHVVNNGDTRSLAIHPATTTRRLTPEEQIAFGVTPCYVHLSLR